MVKMEQSNVILYTYLVLDVKIHISDVGRMKEFYFKHEKNVYDACKK